MDSKTQKTLKEYRQIVTRGDLSLQIYLGCMEIENKSISLEKVPNHSERYVQSELDLDLNIEVKEKSKDRRKSRHLLDLIALAKEVVDNRYAKTTRTHPHFEIPSEIENYFNKRNQTYLQRFSHWPC